MKCDTDVMKAQSLDGFVHDDLAALDDDVEMEAQRVAAGTAEEGGDVVVKSLPNTQKQMYSPQENSLKGHLGEGQECRWSSDEAIEV